MMTALLSPKLWIAIAFAALLAVVGFQQVRISNAKTNLAEERQERAEETSERERIARRATERNREIEQERQAEAGRLERLRDEQTLALNDRLRDALGRLSDRPDRPASGGQGSGNPAAPTSCTGAGLYRSDGQFLARLAARAAAVVAERDYCHARYEALLQPADGR